MSTVNYKDTLNLPDTTFPMKANLAQREPETLAYWQKIALYQQLAEQAKAQNKPIFSLPDGPPFANGPIHLGHAVNKILKDFVIKSKTLGGYYVPFIPGWDCHGLPIELNVEKQVGKPGAKVDAKTFRQKCREYVLKQVDLQREAFVRLGVLGDWSKPYLTMDYKYEADIIRALSKIVANGHLHKGYKPVHWCIDCGSALAEAEVEYQDKNSPSIDVAFPVIDQQKAYEAFSHFPSTQKPAVVWIVIWTTTPWTLPANQAVAVDPDLQYALVSDPSASAYCIVASDLVNAFASRAGWTAPKILAECSGSALEGLRLQHPFYQKTVPLLLGTHVTVEAGTGCVHIAPAHGQEDYILGEKYQLPVENPVGANGCYFENIPLFGGQHVFKANDAVIEILRERGYLLGAQSLQHSYPHCWRHKTPLIFRATQQWFISMEQKGLRRAALEAIQTVEWIPNWGKVRIESMMGPDRPDWCISRQRTWGVPMGVFVHRETGDLHPNTLALMEKVAEQVEQQGIDAWYDLSIEDLLGSDAKYYEKSPHTLDVWFDSGVYQDCVLDKQSDLKFPADLYLEGSDQHRGWFQSSLLTAVAIKNTAPYKQVLTHGFTVDPQGHKMSKSLGNVIPPEKVINQLGADVLRLWIASTDYRSEMVVSDDILKQSSDIYRRIRNTARFLLSNLNGFIPEEHVIPANQLLALDRFIVERAQSIQKDIIAAFEGYQFHLIYQLIHHFCAVELGGFYLDIIKDRQYTGKTEGLPRRSAQTALYYIAEALVRWIAPILSFTAEEIWQSLPGKHAQSVFLSAWYQDWPLFEQAEKKNTHSTSMLDAEFWRTILSVRDEVNKVLENARTQGVLGSALEAELELYADPKYFALLSRLEDELRFVFITSSAKVHPESAKSSTAQATALSGLWVSLSASTYPKCERCWHRRADVNMNTRYPSICARCVENIAEAGELRHYA